MRVMDNIIDTKISYFFGEYMLSNNKVFNPDFSEVT